MLPAPARPGSLSPSSNASTAPRVAVGAPCGFRCPRVDRADAPRVMSNRHPEAMPLPGGAVVLGGRRGLSSSAVRL